MKYLIDTNVLSETIKPSPNHNVIEFLEKAPVEDMYISVLTIGKIRKGIEGLAEMKKRQKLLHWLEVELVEWFSEHNIIPINVEIAEKWGYLTAHLKNQIPTIDGLIAASALVNNLVVVTRNISDFEKIPGLELFNPWEKL